MTFTRRDFLKTGGAAVTVSFLAPRLAFPSSMQQDRILVILQLAGGNDGINTFIPYTDAKYRSARPTLAIPDTDILKVDSQLGFHPSLAELAELYQQRRFTFVNHVGFGSLDRSHFHCQDIWQTGLETHQAHGDHARTGWLGRWADQQLGFNPGPLAALSVGSRIPLGMAAAETVPAAISSLDSFAIPTGTQLPADRNAFLATLENVWMNGHGNSGHHDVRRIGADLFDSIELLESAPEPSETAGYPESPLARGLQLVAQVLAGGYGTRIVWVTTGGYDTHSAQGPTHAALLGDVSRSLGAFQRDLDERRLADRTVVMAWSEFGRRVAENGSAGTDHGRGNTVFLLGNAVNGGSFYGDAPNLGILEDGDLPVHIDFRSVYWTLIQDWLGGDPEPVLMGRYENLGFLTAQEPARPRRVRRG